MFVESARSTITAPAGIGNPQSQMASLSVWPIEAMMRDN
jgi:hypothetical protein